MKISTVRKAQLTTAFLFAAVFSTVLATITPLHANEANPSATSEHVINGREDVTNNGTQDLSNKRQNIEQGAGFQKELLQHLDTLPFSQPKHDRQAEHEQKLSPTNSIAKDNKPQKKETPKEADTTKSTKSKHDASESFSIRKTEIAKSSHYGDFSIYDARVFLNRDIDGDGYYSEFDVVFDADTQFQSADVYGVLYISRHGGPWEFYYETDVFQINGSDSDDDYTVTTTLNYNFPSAEYDILIDLYEYGYSGVAATISSAVDSDLYDVPLEDRSFEVSYASGFDIHDITTTLTTDRDGDGFFSSFNMSIDVDTVYAESLVYAQIYFLNEYNEWELEFTSSDVSIFSNSSNDSIDVDFHWQSGYPTRHYDFKVVVIDAFSQQRLFETGRNYAGLNALPLESSSVDNTANQPPVSFTNSTTSSGAGGGAFGSYAIILLCLLIAIRWLHSRNATC